MFRGGFPGFPTSGSGRPPQMPQFPQNPGANPWQEYTSPDGRKYYFNRYTNESTWEKPKAHKGRRNAQFVRPPHCNNFPPAGGNGDGNRPVNRFPISGTPWVIVWNADGSIVFINVMTEAVVSQVPPEVSNHPDVKNALNKRPTDTFPLLPPAPQSLMPHRPPYFQIPTGRMPHHTDAWVALTTISGLKCYINLITQESTWDKPKVVMDKEASDMDVEQPTLLPQPTITSSQSTASTVTPAKNTKLQNGDGTNPVCSHPLTGTPWHLVWTVNGGLFYHNQITKLSIWERPQELFNRPDVDLLVNRGPPKKESDASTKISDGSSVSKTSQHGDSESEEMKAPPKKKIRQDENEDQIKEQKVVAQEERKELVQEERKVVQERKEEETNSILKDDPAIKSGIEAMQVRAEIPFEARHKQFYEMLIERGVSADSTFQKELPKIVNDSRYLLLSTMERKKAFEEYTEQLGEIQHAEKKAKAKLAKGKYIMLLVEAELDVRSSFSSFSSKYDNDERFKAVEKRKDRERFFKDYVDDLYKRHKEDQQKRMEESKFRELLKDKNLYKIHRSSKWSHVRKRIISDPRYIGKYLNTEVREEMFKQYIATLPAEKEELDDEGKSKENDPLEVKPDESTEA